MRDGRILRLVFHTAWALDLRVFSQLARIVQRHAAGEPASPEDLAAARAGARARAEAAGAANPRDQLVIQGSTAVVPIRGVITPHGDMMDDISGPGSASLARIDRQLQEAIASEQVRAIVLDVDSPGGSVDGVSELAAAIRAAKAKKPVYAIANTNALSAAYWLAAQATKVYATNGARVGSIGIAMTAVDERRALENRGIDIQLVTSNELKSSSTTQTAISTAELRAVAQDVQAYHDLFVDDIAAGRGIDRAAAAALATGAVSVGQQAMDLGLVDGVTSWDALLSSLNEREEPMSKPQKSAPSGAGAAGKGAGGKGAGQQKAEGDVVVQVEKPTGEEEDPEKDPEEEDEPKTGEASKAKPAATKPDTSGAVQKDPRIAAELLAEGGRIERERVRAIKALGKPGQEDVVEALIESGASVEDAGRALEANRAGARGRRLEKLRQDTDADEVVETASAGAGGKSISMPKAWAEEWKDAKVQATFDGKVDAFVRFKEAEAKGHVRFVGRAR